MVGTIEDCVSARRGKLPVIVQDVMLEFVDCACRIRENFRTGSEFKHNPRDLVESQLPTTYFSAQERQDTLGLLDAVLYAAAASRLDIVEIHRRVTASQSSTNFRLPSSRAHLLELVEEVESQMSLLDGDPDVRKLFELAGYALSRFQALRPFRDGNGRVGEVLVAFILKQVSPFPHRVYPVGPPYYQRCSVARDGSATKDELASYMIQQAYLRWTRGDMSEDQLLLLEH